MKPIIISSILLFSLISVAKNQTHNQASMQTPVVKAIIAEIQGKVTSAACINRLPSVPKTADEFIAYASSRGIQLSDKDALFLQNFNYPYKCPDLLLR